MWLVMWLAGTTLERLFNCLVCGSSHRCDFMNYCMKQAGTQSPWFWWMLPSYSISAMLCDLMWGRNWFSFFFLRILENNDTQWFCTAVIQSICDDCHRAKKNVAAWALFPRGQSLILSVLHTQQHRNLNFTSFQSVSLSHRSVISTIFCWNSI